MDRAQMPEKLDSFKKAPLPVSGGGIFLAKRGRGVFFASLSPAVCLQG